MSSLYPRFLLAAPGSGNGKTVITCGLLTAFLNRKLSCRSFKCGPDYIDPMFHRYVLGIEGGNLDTFFLDKAQVKARFKELAEGFSLSVIEGVMGYYDGIGGNTTQASSYEVAGAISVPVVLLLDGKGASLSLAAIVKGFLEYKDDSRIAGVILNRCSPVLAERLRPALEEMGVRLYGCLPECEEARLDSRHLGLVLPEEIEGFRQQLQKLAVKIEASIDVEGLLELAQSAPPLDSTDLTDSTGLTDLTDLTQSTSKTLAPPKTLVRSFGPIPIAIAKDAAFCFYYQENLHLLEEMGAKLIPFSPLTDSSLPDGICGLLLGGGYPENHCQRLSENHSMLQAIRKAHAVSLPILAECGGFLYLHKELAIKDGRIFPLAGIINGRAYPLNRLSRFGYIEVQAKETMAFLEKGELLRGHEFHYWESTNNGEQMEAKKPGTGQSWDCVHGTGNLFAGFPHFYYPSNPKLIKRFMEVCKCARN